MEQRQKLIEECMKKIIVEGLGLDLSDPNLTDTPKRVAKMYLHELFKGLHQSPPDAAVFPNEHKYNQIVMSDNISFHSVCSHHFLPFSGKAWVLYIPSETGNVIGISKLARVVQHFSAKPQLQENLTEEITNYLMGLLNPDGLMVVMRATHGCMVCRGVRQPGNAGMTTSAVRGKFQQQSTKEEGMSLIHLSTNLSTGM